MAYVTRAQVEAEIPGAYLIDALDDDKDGAEDPGQFDAVVAKASQAVDAYLSGVYATPFIAVPSKVAEAAFVFVCEMIYARRGVPEDQNPYTKRANGWRSDLKAIGSGDMPLDASLAKSFTPGAAVTDAMATEASTS